MTRLGDVGKVITGNTPKTSDSQNYASNNICFVKPSDIADGTVAFLDHSEFYISQYARAKARVLPPQSVLVTCIGIIGKVAINNVECAFNQQINAIIPDESKCLTEYLAYAIQNKQPEMQDIANAPVVPILNKTQFSDIEIKLPSLSEQKDIVEKLNTVSKLITLRKEQLAKLDQLIKSRFIELFDDKHETKPLQAVCEELFAGGDVKKDKSSDTQSEEYPYPIYTNGEKDNGLYGYTSIVRVAKEAVTISGRGTIGFTCLRKEPFYPAVRLIVAVPKQELVNGCYLQHFIQSKNYGGQGASIPQLTVPMIKDEPIPVPPMELQKQFTAFVEQTDKSKLAIQQSLDKLELLKKSLMQEYFG